MSRSFGSMPALETPVPDLPKVSKMMKGLTIALVVFALLALGLTAYLYKEKTEALKADAARQEADAAVVRHVTAQSLRTDEIAEPVVEDNTILLSLFSEPAGASVFYADGRFLGTTPIEQKKVTRSGEETFIISLEGYEVERKTVLLAANIQDRTTLVKLPEPEVEKVPKEKKIKIDTSTEGINFDF